MIEPGEVALLAVCWVLVLALVMLGFWAGALFYEIKELKARVWKLEHKDFMATLKGGGDATQKGKVQKDYT